MSMSDEKRIIDHDVMQKLILKNLRTIVKEVEPRGEILDLMVQDGVITFEERMELDTVKLREDCVRKLLNIILTSSRPQTPELFLEALDQRYKHISESIRGKLETPDSKGKFTQQMSEPSTSLKRPIDREENLCSVDECEDVVLAAKRHQIRRESSCSGVLRRQSKTYEEDAEEVSMEASTSGMSCQSDASTSDEKLNFNKPVVVQYSDICRAAFTIRKLLPKTPCHRSHMSKLTDMEIYFKKDFMQYTGSFKERGVRFALMMLNSDERKRGVVTASSGNHALALAYHGRGLKLAVTVVMPHTAPMMTAEQCSKFGACVIRHGDDFEAAMDEALKLAREKNMHFISGYDDPHVIAGQGTLGMEIHKSVPDVDAVIVPVGGGGLLAGVALAIKSNNRNIKVYGAECERCPSFSNAMAAGKPVFTKSSTSLADGLAAPIVGKNAFVTAQPLVDKILVVSEEYIALAILRLVEMEKSIVEGSGAIGLAAVLQGLVPELKGKKVVIPLTGGNIDTHILGRCLDRGLAADGRLCWFVVTISTKPGSIAELAKKIASIDVSIKGLFQERRSWGKSSIFNVQVKCIVETRDHAHVKELEHLLSTTYSNVYFGQQAIDNK